MKKYKIDFKSLTWETPVIGVKCKVYEENNRKLRLVEFSQGFVELGWCRKGHIGFVLKGEIEIKFSGESVFFSSGDGLFIPAGENHKHMANALTDTVKLILLEDV